MKNPVRLGLLTLIALVCSCNKDEPPGPSPSALLKSMVYYDTTGQQYAQFSSFQYDPSGRISQATEDIYGWKIPVQHTFHYDPTRVIQEYSYSNSYIAGRITFYLNDEGLAVADTQFSFASGRTFYMESTGIYKYNADGYLVEHARYIEGDTSRWTSEIHQITNGNVISTTHKNYLYPESPVIVTYEYYPNTVNTLGNANMGKLFFGRSSNNLVKSSLTHWTNPRQATYTYSFDADNRVSQQFIRGKGYLIESRNLSCTYY